MAKFAIALVLGFAVYMMLGLVLPMTGATAIIFPLLGSFGAFSYKGVIAICTFSALSARL